MYPRKPARFQHSQLRLWLSVVCASLTLGSALVKADLPALSQPPRRISTTKRAPAVAVIKSIRQALKQQFGVAQIAVVRVDEQIWPDGCLGLAQEREVCSKSSVTGWQIEVSDNLQTWIYRTDLTGKTLRLEYPNRRFLPQSVARKLIQQVARETNNLPAKLRITEVRAKTYDGCLGIDRPGRACTKIAIPGWQSIVTAPDVTYIYHLSQNANRIARNETASGAKRAITVSFELQSKILPLATNEIFRSQTSGGMTGTNISIVLTADGKITRYQSSLTGKLAPVVIKTLSREQLNTFKKLLARQFPNLNGLSYLTSAQAADGTSTLYQSQSTAVSVIDGEKPNLPRSLQQTIGTWEWACAPVKSITPSR